MVGENEPRLARYERWLDRVRIVWMHGREIGMVMERATVALWPYEVPTFTELARILTHEIVHLAHPKAQEGAVWAVTTSLMDRPAWVRRVQQKLGEALFEGVQMLRKKNISELG